MDKFYITSQTKLIWNCNMTEVLKKAENRWKRDIDWTVSSKEKENNIEISLDTSLEREMFCWEIRNKNLCIRAADELGILYALFFISEKYLGIKPLWFWNDQKFVKKEKIEIEEKKYTSEKFAVLYRGWFFQDAVLIDIWNLENNSMYAWEMAMEALLRLGGNTISIQMGKNDERISRLAEKMGLWVLQPKEKLGQAENQKVIWNLGSLEEILNFSRKNNETEYLGEKEKIEKEAEQINQTIKMQYNKIRELTGQETPAAIIEGYGEISKIYKNEMLTIPKGIIKVWEDNGYGKMIWEEEDFGNIDFSINSIESILEGENGVYYHASICNLEAGSYLTMLSSSPEFAVNELIEAFARGADKLLIVNASNIKPHVLVLDLIAKLWRYGTAEIQTDCQEYVENYYPENWKEICGILRSYHRYMLYYGGQKWERVGEQFYHSMLRGLAHGWLKDDIQTEDSVRWATDKKRGLKRQFRWLEKVLEEGIEGLWLTYQKCYNLYEKLTERGSEERQLFYDSIYLQTILHYFSAKAVLEFCYAFNAYLSQKYPEAFVAIGKSIELFQSTLDSIKKAEHDKWIRFYESDCFTDIKLTIYCLKNVRSFIRNIGEGPDFQAWKGKFLNSEEKNNFSLKKRIYFTDEELYQVMKDEVYLKNLEKKYIDEIN